MIDYAPLDGLLQQSAKHRQHVVDGFRGPLRKTLLQPLNVLGADLVPRPRPEQRQEMIAQYSVLMRNSPELLLICACVFIKEPRREVF